MKILEEFIKLAGVIDKINPRSVMKAAVQENETKIISLHERQLERGKDQNDSDILPSYASPYYANRKQSLNNLPSYGTPDLTLSGERGRTAFLEVGLQEYFFRSGVSYQSNLEERYPEAFDLNIYNKGIIIPINTRTFFEVLARDYKVKLI